MTGQRWPSRQRDALLGMVPIVTLLGGVEIGDRLATAVGLPGWLGASVTGVAAFFVSRAILVRAFATKGR